MTTTTTPKITTIKPTPFNWFTSEPTTIKTTSATDNPFLIFASTTGANNIILPSTLANAVENNIDAGLFSSLGGQGNFFDEVRVQTHDDSNSINLGSALNV